jgi:hypothetical protein
VPLTEFAVTGVAFVAGVGLALTIAVDDPPADELLPEVVFVEMFGIELGLPTEEVFAGVVAELQADAPINTMSIILSFIFIA